jgi:AcrR family transcriptional regulator
MKSREVLTAPKSAIECNGSEHAITADCSSAQSIHGGRPRSERSRIALLETAYELMTERPPTAISTQQIAAKAGVSTATVYRWWPTKEALLVDAVLHVKMLNVPMEKTGTPLERLRAHAIAGGKFLQGTHGLVAARLLAAIQDDLELREHFTERFYIPHSSELLQLAQEAVDTGELPPKTDIRLFLDMQFGACLTRLLMRHEPIRWSDSAAAFDLAVAGARAYWSEE